MNQKTADFLETIQIEPKNPAKRSMIWLHGLGADANDFTPMVSQLKLPLTDIRFVFPHAPIIPITINNGYEMPGWYDIYSLSKHGPIDHVGITNTISAIGKLIQREIDSGIAVENIMLGGFSQGAVMALMTGLHYHQRLAGIVALSGYLPLLPDNLNQLPKANAQIPVFIAHGSEDMVVPFGFGHAAVDLLKAVNYPVTWKSYPIAHTVSMEEIADISTWIQTIWR